MMLHRMVAISLMFLFFATAARCGDDAKADLEKLGGSWFVEAIEHHGAPTFFGIKLEGKGEALFTGDKISLRHFYRPLYPPRDGERRDFEPPECVVKVVASLSPKAIDLTAVNGPRKGKTVRGLYQLEGDVLRLCLAMEGNERPSEFPTRPAEPRLEIVAPTDTKAVAGLALSGDGGLVLTGSEHDSAAMFDATTGKRVQAFPGSAVGIVFSGNGVALSSDGKLVVTGSIEQRAYLWDAATGKKLQTFEGHTHHFVTAVALSSDGKHVVTACPSDPVAIVWEAATGKKLQTLKGHTGGVTSVSLSSDGKQVVTGSYDHMAIVWDLVTGQKLQSFRGHTNEVGSVVLSTDGKLVVTGSDDCTAIVWDAGTGKAIQTLKGEMGAVTSVALSSDGKWIVTGAGEGAIIWDTATGKKLRTFKTRGISRVALSSNGDQLWTACYAGTVLWNPRSGKELCSLLSLNEGEDWLVVTPAGLFDGSKGAWKYVTYRAAGTRDLINDNATREKFYRPSLLAQLVRGEKPTSGRELESAKGPDLLVLTLRKDVHALEGGRPGAYSNVAFSPDSKVLASIEEYAAPRVGSSEAITGDRSAGPQILGSQTLVLRNVEKRKVIATFQHQSVRTLAFSPDGRTVASAGMAGYDPNTRRERVEVKLWDLATGKEKSSLEGHSGQVRSLAFSPDGKFIASAANEVKLWDLSTGKAAALFDGQRGQVFCVAFSPDSKLIACGTGTSASNGQPSGGELKLWDVVTGKEKASLKAPMVWVSAVAFSPNGKILASGDVYGDVFLWNMETGKRTATLQAFNPKGREEDINGVLSVAFTPDGKTLAAGTVRGIKLWDVQSGRDVGPLKGRMGTVWSVAFSPDGKWVASAGSKWVVGRLDSVEDDPVLRLYEWMPRADK
jgi:uncharacterized protein (TIGR03067 family)